MTTCFPSTRRASKRATPPYPDNDDVPGDENYVIDVHHARAEIQPFRAYCLPGTPDVLVSAARVHLLTRALAAVEAGSLRVSDMRTMMERSRAAGKRARDPNEHDYRDAVSNVLGRAANPDGWCIPVTSRRVFGRAPDAAIAVYVGCRLGEELASLASKGRFSFEPEDPA